VVDTTTGDHLEDPQAEDTIMVDTIVGDQLEDPQAEDTILVDMVLLIVEEQIVDRDTIVVHMVLDPADTTLELAQAQARTGLDQTQGFWPEYWVEDQKLRMRIL